MPATRVTSRWATVQLIAMLVLASLGCSGDDDAPSRPTLGEPCNTIDGCSAGLRCVRGLCEPLEPDSGPTSMDAETGVPDVGPPDADANPIDADMTVGMPDMAIDMGDVPTDMGADLGADMTVDLGADPDLGPMPIDMGPMTTDMGPDMAGPIDAGPRCDPGMCDFSGRCLSNGERVGACLVCDGTLDPPDVVAAPDGTSCDDGISCTTDDVCMSGSCRRGMVSFGFCLDGSICRNDGYRPSGNSCRSCDSAANPMGLTNEPDETSCTESADCHCCLGAPFPRSSAVACGACGNVCGMGERCCPAMMAPGGYECVTGASCP